MTGAKEHLEKLESNFACRCDDDGGAECDRVKEWARGWLGGKTDDSNFVTGVVIALNWRYDAAITAIHNDQWSAVSAETSDQSFSTWIQCDYVEDGFAYTLRKFYDQFGESRT